MNSQAQHSHTQLYIVVGLLVLFSILFFMFKANEKEVPFPILQKDSTPLELRRLVLSAEQIAKQQAALTDPQFSQTKVLTKSQQVAQSKALSTEIKPAM